MKKFLLLLISHGAVAFAGFAAGIYFLPILTAPDSPSQAALSDVSDQARYTAEFTRDLAGSDFLHWGEGTVSISDTAVALDGKLAPGPDYKLYLSPTFVEDEAGFEAARASMVQVGNVSTFENFMVSLPGNVEPSAYTTVIVWCEAFGEFITSAAYR